MAFFLKLKLHYLSKMHGYPQISLKEISKEKCPQYPEVFHDSHLLTLLRLSYVNLNFADLIFLYSWVGISGFLSLDKTFNRLVSFVKNDTLFWTERLWFIYSILE